MFRPPDSLDAGPLTLHRLRPGDAAELSAAVTESLAHLRPWMAWATAENATFEAQRKRCVDAGQHHDDGTAFLYVARVHGTLVGTIGLHGQRGGIELGYWIHVAHVGNGYATSAAGAATAAAFRLPWVHHVEIHCDVGNAASAAVARKLGYGMVRVESTIPQAPAETRRHQIWRSEQAVY